jgi:hypothetical protein
MMNLYSIEWSTNPRLSADQDAEHRDRGFISNMFGAVFSCSSADKCVPSVCCSQPDVNVMVADMNPDLYKGLNSKKNITDKCVNHVETLMLGQSLLRKPTIDDAGPHWTQYPNPMPGWTMEEQRELMETCKALHGEWSNLLEFFKSEERAHWEYMRLVAQYFPGKSAEDCDRCLRHLTRTRATY